MYTRNWLRVGFAGSLALLAGCSQADESKGGGITPEFLHGDWCQIVEIEEEDEAPVVERHSWTFRPDGVFLRHFQHNEPLQTTWALADNVLRIPMLGNHNLTRVSEDEFQFRRFVLNRVVRGACDETD